MQGTPGTDEERITTACAACGAPNRIPRARLRDGPRCGHCHCAVFPARPRAVDEQSWRAEVEEFPLPVLVDFWAPWCGPCRALAPVIERVAAERAGRLKVVQLNVDQNPRLAARFQVSSIPKLVLVSGRLVLDEALGALAKPALDRWLSRHLGETA